MRIVQIAISMKWIKRISIFYLLIPFLVFCFGFIKVLYALPIVLILFWIIVNGWKKNDKDCSTLYLAPRVFIFTIISVLAWVALSGIGGFAFQNSDFHTRNAIFRDLITYPWPVKYTYAASITSSTYNLVYYIGFWLPAALVGKLAGWTLANITLYLWTVTGIILTLFILFLSNKSRPGFFILLLIFFSGMDAFGTFILGLPALPGKIFPALWPPFMHLEWWIPGFQYSSLTTQLFWVFNQAVPAWLCMSLILFAYDKKSIIFIYSLFVFYAPLPAIGFIPYLLLKLPQELFNPENLRSSKFIFPLRSTISRLLSDLSSLITVENILGGGIILCITYLYFSGNVISSRLTFRSMTTVQWLRYAFFVVFEAFVLWFLLAKEKKYNLNWYVAGFCILFIPLIQVGTTQDFCMRVSIPTIFLLMIWSAEVLASPRSKIRTLIIIILLIGVITPVYEINRSIYRTSDYLLNPPSQSEKMSGEQMKIYNIVSFEYDHPFTLTADSFKSLANIAPETIPYFLAKSDHSFFYTYLAK